MNDAENELCKKLADALFLRCNDDDSWSQTAREKLLPLIRSYANALVAAAVGECAKEVHRHQIAEHLHEDVGYAVTNRPIPEINCLSRIEECIRSTITPESVAKELERVKEQSYERGMRAGAHAEALLQHIFDEPGPLKDAIEKCKAKARLEELKNISTIWYDFPETFLDYLEQRIAALKAAKEK